MRKGKVVQVHAFRFSLRAWLGPWMKFPVYLAQTAAGDVSINFCRADAGMAKEFLDDAQVGAVFEQMRRKTVAQHVRRHVPRNTRAPDAIFDSQPERD